MYEMGALLRPFFATGALLDGMLSRFNGFTNFLAT
jgi:hypothetical protein